MMYRPASSDWMISQRRLTAFSESISAPSTMSEQLPGMPAVQVLPPSAYSSPLNPLMPVKAVKSAEIEPVPPGSISNTQKSSNGLSSPLTAETSECWNVPKSTVSGLYSPRCVPAEASSYSQPIQTISARAAWL